MIILAAYPPNWAELVAACPVAAGQPVLVAWGDAIYNPRGIEVTPELHAHEAVHGARQGADVAGWWWRYLADPEFRLAEELAAHRAEYTCFCVRHADRNARARYRTYVARRLASPLYGSLLTFVEALREVR